MGKLQKQGDSQTTTHNKINDKKTKIHIPLKKVKKKQQKNKNGGYLAIAALFHHLHKQITKQTQLKQKIT